MKFDVAIGNPPYNKGMDLDFIDIAFEMSRHYVIMITPAKWQTTPNNYSGCASKYIDYKEFRNKIVPHMSHVIFYPCCKDIFNILQVDGITYYMINKNNTYKNKCKVINKSKYIKAFNSIQIRDITNKQSLINIGNEIYEYIKESNKYKQFHFNTIQNGNWQVWTNTQVPGGNLSTLTSKRKTLFIGESSIYHINHNILHSKETICSFSSNNIDECKSFISWLDCKLTKFFTAINQSKMTGIITDDNFRFVPAPPSGRFDHIYNDQELYEEFNVPQKYIDIIEDIVKSREE